MEAALTDVRSPRLRLGVLLWLGGMLGAVVLTVLILPDLLAGEALPVPLWALTLASVAQSGVLLALGTWTGVALARKVGLHAPAFEAAAASQPVAPALRPQLAPGLLWGLLAGALLAALSLIAPAALTAVQARFDPPLVARVLYGGITEELLLRWGLMTLLVWAAWRFVQRGQGAPRALYVWAAIGLSALLFGAGHLPTAAAVVGDLTMEVSAFVVGANTVFGVLFGYLYWRYGLEAAMIAHAFAHVVGYTATLF
jgi:hypothetical protein